MKEEKRLPASTNVIEECSLKTPDYSEEVKTLTSIRLRISTYQDIEDIAASHGLSKSEVMRQLIRSSLQEVDF